MSNVLVYKRAGTGKRLQYNSQKDSFEMVSLDAVVTGPVAIDVCCRLFAVTIITNEFKAYQFDGEEATELFRVNIQVPVQKVFGTYSEYYYITSNNNIVDSHGTYYPKSTFNGGDVYLIGCTCYGVTFVTTNGLFYKGSSSYGELGTEIEDTLDITESPFSETLRKRGEKVVQIQCGDHNTVLLTDHGKAYITGYCLHGIMPCIDEPYSAKQEDHLYSYTQIDLPEPITQICCSFYHMCFVCKSGDLWTSKGLLDLMYTLDMPYDSCSISGTDVSLHHFESSEVCEGFGSQIASVKGGDYASVVITKVGEVFMPCRYEGIESTEKMKKLDADLVHSISGYGTSLAASLGEFCAIFSLPTYEISYSQKMYTQAHSKNPFTDVTVSVTIH